MINPRCVRCTCAAVRNHYMKTQWTRYREALQACCAEYEISAGDLRRYIETTPTPCYPMPPPVPAKK